MTNARLIALVLAGAALLAARTTSARDDRLTFKVKDALEHGESKQKLNPNIKLYFGKIPHPKPVQDLGDFEAKEKTRSFHRTDQEACDWVFLSAVLKLQEHAQNMQADAIVDIESDFKGQPLVSDKEYLCDAGSIMSGVTLKGRLVKLKK
ncbi:MAG TPA: excinuclease ABC subunit A [Polyangia bacterium]|jgi:uncharacterized protein YbjQ (UPF0145 family)|nr:excinuclease ABC subunit A [Polyangia bacterium]